MPTRSRTLLAVLSLVLAGSLAVMVDGVAAASPRTVQPVASAARSSASSDGPSMRLGADTVVPRRDGRTVIRKWQVHTLYFSETLPAKWDWSLSTAVAKWNASGAGIRLVRTISSRKARVRISYGRIGSAAGLATVGATRNAFVRLSSTFAGWDALDARNRVLVMNVLAHELGHVLGFQHTSTRCSLMAPVLDVDSCGIVPALLPGYYKCRTIDTGLVRRLVARYGGRARFPSASWCLIDPLPPVLTGVTFTGGASGPVTLHWTPPGSVPAGTTLVLKRWEAATCGTAPAWADAFRPSLASGVWRDQVTRADETDCFQLQLLNRYGAGRPAQKRVLARWVSPPGAPVIGKVTWDPAAHGFHAAASYPASTHLVVDTAADPATCPGAYARGEAVAQDADRLGAGVIEFLTPFPDQCVSFYAVDDRTGRASDPRSITVHAPLPTETLDPVLRLEPRAYPWWYARVSGLAPAQHLGYSVLHGSCPLTVPDVDRWRVQLLGDVDPTTVPDARSDALFPSQGAGVNCALFTSLDWWGWQGSAVAPGEMTDRHGPVVMREFVDEGPVDPVVLDVPQG